MSRIEAINAEIDAAADRGNANRWRWLCWVWPHRWQFWHLFDEGPDPSDGDPGSSHYHGVCSRCGAKNLFRASLRPAYWTEKQDG